MAAMQTPNPSRILIADDDRALCGLLAEYLRREGFMVDLAHDGAEALVRLRNPAERPDLLIRDGMETLRELRMQHRLPVIMLSARGEPVDRVIGLELGADDYLAKPCLPRELVDKAALTRLALGRELERFDRSIDVHVSRLRHKLAEASPEAPRIESVRGSGYVLVAAAP